MEDDATPQPISSSETHAVLEPPPSAVQATGVAAPENVIGNTNDVITIVTGTVAAITGLCCVTGGNGIYILPFVALILGIVTLINSRTSRNPDRSRRWGWISIVTGGLVLCIGLVAIAVFFLFYLGIFAWAFTASPSLPRLTPTLPPFR